MSIEINLKIDKKRIKAFKKSWNKQLKWIKESDWEEFYDMFKHLESDYNDGRIRLSSDSYTLSFEELSDMGIINLFNSLKAKGLILSEDYDTEDNNAFAYYLLINYGGKGTYTVKNATLRDVVCVACMKELGKNYIVNNGNAYCNKKCAVAGEL